MQIMLGKIAAEFKTQSKFFSGVTEDNHVQFSKNSPSPSQDLNTEPPIDRYIGNLNYRPITLKIKGIKRGSLIFLRTR